MARRLTRKTCPCVRALRAEGRRVERAERGVERDVEATKPGHRTYGLFEV